MGRSPQRSDGSDRDGARSTTNSRRRFGFGKKLRIRKRREFLAMRGRARDQRSAHFIVVSRELSGSSCSRMGVTVSRKVGNAVQRNRLKRLVREFFRQSREEIVPPRDFVVIARTAAEDLSYSQVAQELGRALGINGRSGRPRCC